MINIDQILEIILYIFLVSAGIQILYYLIIFIRIFAKPKKEIKTEKIPVSVIIAARNEANNLQKFLPTVLEQKYDNFEVIVVNDASDDNSDSILRRFQQKYKNLYVTSLPLDTQFSHGKKLAQTLGIKAAKNEWLLFTDADCIIDSNLWLEKMQANFTENTEIVLGYGGYIKKRGLLNLIIRYDTVFIAIQYITYAMMGLPYMGVGRNMAYRKSTFFKNKGFASHLKLLSGSDDLFVNENATKKNIKVEFSSESFTHSVSKETFSDWIIQKKRHFTTGKHYKFKHKMLLGLEVFSRQLFYILFIILAIYWNEPIIIFSVLGFRTLVYSIVILRASHVFREKGVGLLFIGIIFDFVQPFVNFIILLSKKLSKKKRNRWK